MLKISRVTNIGLIFALLIIPKTSPPSLECFAAPYSPETDIAFQYVNAQRWKYLRLGLNYLESPKPFLPPEAVSPAYIHPDLKGAGAYGFTPAAYQDVQRIYPYFRDYSWDDIMHSRQLYELANQAFADWLFKNLQDYIPNTATERQVFDVIEKAWNTGLSGFKNGRKIASSRVRMAEEFKARYLIYDSH